MLISHVTILKIENMIEADMIGAEQLFIILHFPTPKMCKF